MLFDISCTFGAECIELMLISLSDIAWVPRGNFGEDVLHCFLYFLSSDDDSISEAPLFPIGLEHDGIGEPSLSNCSLLSTFLCLKSGGEGMLFNSLESEDN